LSDIVLILNSCVSVTLEPGLDPGEAIGAIILPKTHESNFIDHDFVKFGKQHSIFKPICISAKKLDANAIETTITYTNQ